MRIIVSNKTLLAKSAPYVLLVNSFHHPTTSFHFMRLFFLLCSPQSDLAHLQFFPNNPCHFLCPSCSGINFYPDSSLILTASFPLGPDFSWYEFEPPHPVPCLQQRWQHQHHTGQSSAELERCSGYRTMCMQRKILSGHSFRFMNLFGSLCSALSHEALPSL